MSNGNFSEIMRELEGLSKGIKKLNNRYVAKREFYPIIITLVIALIFIMRRVYWWKKIIKWVN